ncbi:hypothetical protein ACFVT5_22700 [Streptomyces sp. NPDC058001]
MDPVMREGALDAGHHFREPLKVHTAVKEWDPLTVTFEVGVFLFTGGSE